MFIHEGKLGRGFLGIGFRVGEFPVTPLFRMVGELNEVALLLSLQTTPPETD